MGEAAPSIRAMVSPRYRARWQRFPAGDGPVLSRAYAVSVISGNSQHSSMAAAQSVADWCRASQDSHESPICQSFPAALTL
jgi:hypothetical protein